MSITAKRRQKEREFTQVHNTMIEDVRLSWKAKGILLYLMSRPAEGWTVNKPDIQNRATDGRESVEKGLEELKKFGYLHIFRVRKETGNIGEFGGWAWEYDDIPYEREVTTEIRESRNTENPNYGKSELRETRTYINTDLINTDLINTDLEKKVSKGRKSAAPKKENVMPIESYDSIIERAYGQELNQVKTSILEFIKMRKMIKKPLTNHALSGIIAKLFTLSQFADDHVKILDQSTMNSWQGVFPLKQDKRGNNENYNNVNNAALRSILRDQDAASSRAEVAQPFNNIFNLSGVASS